MSCGEPAFWNEIHASKDKVQEQVSLSDENPFEAIGSTPDEDEARIEEFFRDVDRREAEQNAYDESFVAQKLSEEHMANQAYLDGHVSKKYVDSQFTLQADSPAIGDLTLNVQSGQMLVHNGSDWQNAEPNGMVGALVVQTPAGEEMDVCAMILELEAQVKDLKRELLGKKINELSDEIDEHRATLNKASAFERAMGGV